MSHKTVLAWSSGKDSAWTLYTMQQNNEYELLGLLTTFNQEFNRVAMHAVRRELVGLQARAADLELFEVFIPWPCSNNMYESAMAEALIELRENRGVTHIAFGDLFLEDIRAYRERMLQELSLIPVFPIWQQTTPELAREMVSSGLKAKITCVDPNVLSTEFAGRIFDNSFIQDLPEGVDPCGENGEFHTFVYAGPMFNKPIAVKTGEIVSRDGFIFADMVCQ